MTNLQKRMQEYEKLKVLSEKYPDLELIFDETLVSKASADKCTCYKIYRPEFGHCAGCLSLHLYFIDLDTKIFICKPFPIYNLNISTLIQELEKLNISKNLILKIISDMENQKRTC